MKLTPLSTNSSESERNPATATLLSDADRQAVAEIAVALRASQHGCIYFGVCNNRLKIEAVEATLEQALQPHGMGIERLVLAQRDTSTDPPTYRARIVNPFDYFDTLPLPQSRLYFVHGLPDLMRSQTSGDTSKVAPVSQLLNYRREYFHDRCVCALFWLDPETVPYLMQNAPDFWSFRSGMAQFTDTIEELRPQDSSGWQHSVPSGRWSGDLEEKLRQLSTYRKKTPPDENAIANLLLDIGRLHVNRHEPQDAFDALREAEDIYERLGLRQRVSDAKTWLSRAFMQTGQVGKAEESIRQAMEIDRELQNESSLATGYNNLSQIYKARGQLEEADKWLHKAMEIDERLGNEPKLAIDHNNLSQIYKARGQLQETERWLRKAIEIDERLGDETNLAIDYNNLSQIYDARGLFEEAERWLRKAMEIDERLGSEPNLAIDYNNLSQIYRARGQFEEAEKWLRKALALMEPKGPSATLQTLKANLEQLEKGKEQRPPVP